MKTRSRQVTLTVLLVLPLVWAALTSSPFVAEPHAQGPSGGMLGPNAPALIDTNGNGPSGGDTPIVPQFGGTTLTVNTPWNCNAANPNNIGQVSNPVGGKFATAVRMSNGQAQSITFSGFTDGLPTGFSFAEGGVEDQPTETASGVGNLLDVNGDGAYETLQGSGTGGVNFSMSFEYADTTGDGNPDYVSLPWAQVAALGWIGEGDGCNDPDPQVYAPLADSNGDGQPDSIVPDLDGNGDADPEFFRSPVLVPAAAPTVNSTALMVLGLLLAALGYWSLKQRQRHLPVG